LSSVVVPIFLILALMALMGLVRRKLTEPKSDGNWVLDYFDEKDREERARDALRSHKYRVERLGATGNGIGRTYRYAIWRGSENVANFAHDFRFDENWFEIAGATLDYNGGDMGLTWEGGGPVYLTLDGEARLDRLLRAQPN
jgi:hypothetical protein